MYLLRSWPHKIFHISYGIGWLCLGIIVGLYLSQFIGLTLPIALIVMTCLSAVVVVFRLRWYGLIFLVLAGFLVGLARGGQYSQQLAPLEGLTGKTLAITGRVLEDPSHTARGDTRLVVRDVKIEDDHFPGTIWVSVQGDSSVGRDDIVQVSGKAKSGFGTYQLMITYAQMELIKPSSDPLLAFRDNFAESVRRVVVEPSASLGLGFVIGQKSALPANFEEQLRIVGLTHLIVASGYNLTILVRLAKRFFEKVSKFLVAFSSLFLVSGFIVISGASPSMVRAGVVAGLSILAWYYGRRFHPVLLILFVASVTGLIQPSYVWADLGWWLSFLAFFGVLVLSPIVVSLIYKSNKEKPAILQLAVESLSAQIMTLPLILMSFGTLSAVALLANIVSAPFIPVAMAVTFLAGIVGMISPVLGTIVGLVAEIILSYFVAVVRWLSAPEWAQFEIAISWQFMLLIYVVILLAVAVLAKKTKHNFRSQSVVE